MHGAKIVKKDTEKNLINGYISVTVYRRITAQNRQGIKEEMCCKISDGTGFFDIRQNKNVACWLTIS